MKTVLGIIGIATLAVTGLSNEAWAEGPRPCDIESERCLAALHLSYPQQRQIDSHRAAAFRQSSLLSAQIDQVESELRFLTLMRRPNRIAIARHEAELRTLRAREQDVWTTYRFQVRSVLGPMQQLAWARCSDRVPGPAWGAGPAWNDHANRVIVVQAPAPRPMAPSPRGLPMARR